MAVFKSNISKTLREKLLYDNDKKLYIIYRMVPLLMTLSDL